MQNYKEVCGTESRVWFEILPKEGKEFLKWAKSLTLCAKLIYNSSHEGDTVLEPFGGSGSTLVAAEQLNRKCCAIELEPKYCDVIVRRYKELCPAVQVKHIRDGVEIYD